MEVLLVTGGAGFIGSNFVKYFHARYEDFILVNVDKLTYAGNPASLKEVEGSERYHFIKGDISNRGTVDYVMRTYKPHYIVNFAAESHVDRSILSPTVFAQTNIIGTLCLLEGARGIWEGEGDKDCRFIQISTDEVYGSLENDSLPFDEASDIKPNSPYSASKASADLLARSYWKTFKLPVIVTRCCNNYGPNQNREKLIPKCITNSIENKAIPIYGSGKNVREWIHVTDHCEAVTKALFHGKAGEVYNIGTGFEISNMAVAQKILKILGKPLNNIERVEDRPGHDWRYALDSSKIGRELGWSSSISFDAGLEDTVKWYSDNAGWWK